MPPRPRHLPALAAGLSVLGPDRAGAHAFQAGAGAYQQFLEGAGVMVFTPGLLLPLAALGILLALWHAEGMVRAWPALIAGLALGIPLAAIAPPATETVLTALGAATAALAALLPRHWRSEALALAALTGLLAMAAGLQGHGLLELPLSIHAGLFFAANLVTACTAGLARVALERVPAQWMRILWRIAASWIAAILVLLLAFALRPAG